MFKMVPTFIRYRYQWEKGYLKNLVLKKQLYWDFVFECSSEGEFEQVYKLIDEVLKKKQKNNILILFGSPSVERTLQKLKAEHDSLLEICCVPLLNVTFPFFSFFAKIKARKYIQVKYDFFPHLLYLAKQSGRSYLINTFWETQKKWKLILFFPFQYFSTATQNTYKNLGHYIHGDRIFYGDFRILRILERQLHAWSTLRSKFPQLENFFFYLQDNKSKVIIHGNFWPEEIGHEWNKNFFPSSTQYVIVPHEINDKTLPYYQNLEKQGKINLLNGKDIPPAIDYSLPTVLFIKGVLCEMYTLGDWAIVGGGYLHKVHSLLEPYLSGAKVFCGAGIFHSQEYSLIFSYDFKGINIATSLKNSHEQLDIQLNLREATPPRNWVSSIEKESQALIPLILS